MISYLDSSDEFMRFLALMVLMSFLFWNGSFLRTIKSTMKLSSSESISKTDLDVDVFGYIPSFFYCKSPRFKYIEIEMHQLCLYHLQREKCLYNYKISAWQIINNYKKKSGPKIEPWGHLSQF